MTFYSVKPQNSFQEKKLTNTAPLVELPRRVASCTFVWSRSTACEASRVTSYKIVKKYKYPESYRYIHRCIVQKEDYNLCMMWGQLHCTLRKQSRILKLALVNVIWNRTHWGTPYSKSIDHLCRLNNLCLMDRCTLDKSYHKLYKSLRLKWIILLYG